MAHCFRYPRRDASVSSIAIRRGHGRLTRWWGASALGRGQFQGAPDRAPFLCPGESRGEKGGGRRERRGENYFGCIAEVSPDRCTARRLHFLLPGSAVLRALRV